MNRHIERVTDNNPDYLWRVGRGMDYGDWLAVDQRASDDIAAAPTTPKELIGTAFWAHSVEILAQMSDAIGRTSDGDRLRGLWSNISAAFTKKFVNADGTLGNGSQTGNVLALKFGLVNEANKKAVTENLVNDIRRRGTALSTGILGTQFILDVLDEAGHSDIACSLLLRTEYPSLGYMIRNGATTIWESWSGMITALGKETHSSQNHYALAAASSFLFRRIAGIDTLAPGFRKIVIRPIRDSRIPNGGGKYDSIMGLIATDWKYSAGGGFSLHVTIPANTTAHIHLPATKESSITEGNTEISARSDMRLLGRSSNECIVEVGSGTYDFGVGA